MFLIGINDFFLKEHWDLDCFIFSEDNSSFIAKYNRNLFELHGSTVNITLKTLLFQSTIYLFILQEIFY